MKLRQSSPAKVISLRAVSEKTAQQGPADMKPAPLNPRVTVVASPQHAAAVCGLMMDPANRDLVWAVNVEVNTSSSYVSELTLGP